MKYLSILLGFVVGYIIIKLWYKNIILHGPNSTMIKHSIFYDANTKNCYRYVPQAMICPVGSHHK